jgi:glycosyltransferase involved in cell wall biosynthesis
MWEVYVASYKRPGMVTTDTVIRDCKIVVPESQAEDYARFEMYNGAEIITLPDDQDGNLCKKRNWILDHATSDWVLIVDDDYQYIGMVEGGSSRRLDLDGVDRMLEIGFTLCSDLETSMWGINVQVDPKFYREYSPLSLLSPILGPFQAFVGQELRYDEDLFLKEDYDLWLRTIYRERKTLRLNRYHYMVDHLSKIGGQVSNRTMIEEERQLRRLREKFGGKVVQWDLEKSINPRVRVPHKGI